MKKQLIANIKQLLKINTFSILSVLLILVSACNSDDNVVRVFEVTMPITTYGLDSASAEAEVEISFSTETIAETTIVLEVTESGVVYGTDYSTSPAVSESTMEITVSAGVESVSFTVTRLVDYIAEGNSVSFSIQSVSDEAAEIVGTSVASVSFEKVVNTGATIDLETGGSTEPNMCYIDLSSGSQTAVRRDIWELGFYNGSENRVYLNSALKVSAAGLEGYADLSSVTSETVLETPMELYSYGNAVEVTSVSELLEGLPVSYTQYGDEDNGIVFTDGETGSLDETAIDEVSSTDSENMVYVVSLGNEIPEAAADAGSINVSGDHRGFMKIRILSDGDTYTIQYADLDATTYNEATITKNGTTNLTAFSLTNGEVVDAQPSEWDINFSGVYSVYSGGYGVTYTDYGLHNTLGNVGMYMLHTEDISGGWGSDDTPANTTISYEDFTLSDVEEDELVYDDYGVIKSQWRSTTTGAYDYIYFVLKDADGNYYKLKFTSLLSAEGERGYSQFEYELL